MPSVAEGSKNHRINLNFWLTFSGVCLLMINPVLMPFFPWLALVFCLSLFLNLQIDKVNDYLAYLNNKDKEFEKNRVFVKLGFYRFYKLITLVLQVAALTIFMLSFALLFGAALTYSNVFIFVVLSCGVLNLFGYIDRLKFEFADIKQAVGWFSFAIMAFLIKFMPIVTLVDKAIVVIAVAAVLGAMIDGHARQKNATFRSVVKLLVFLSSVAFFKVILGLAFPTIAVNLLWVSAVICSGLLLKSYYYCTADEDVVNVRFDADQSKKDDKALSYLADIFNKFSLVYELFLLLWAPLVSVIVSPSSLLSFLLYILLAVCIIKDTLNIGGLISKTDDKYDTTNQILKDSILLFGNDVADFFKKFVTWSLILSSFSLSNNLRLTLLAVCVSVSILASVSKQIAGVIKKVTPQLEKTLTSKDDIPNLYYILNLLLVIISSVCCFLGFVNISWPCFSIVALFCLIINKQTNNTENSVLKASFTSLTICALMISYGYTIHLILYYIGVTYIIKGILPLSLLLGLVVSIFINQEFIKSNVKNLEGCEFEKKAPWFFSMLKNITGCFRILLPYFGINNSAIMLLFMSCSPVVKIFLASLCGFSSLFEGYLFLTYVLFPLKKEGKKDEDTCSRLSVDADFWPNLSVIVNLFFLFIMCSNLLTFNINVAFLGGACFVVSLIDFYLKESEHDGLKDLVKFLAVFMNLAVMFCVCKAIVSLYCTSLILDGMIAVSSIVSVIVTACLSFYYVKNQLGNMKTTFSKIILTRLSGLLLFSSFLFRLGGTYCVVILALNKIPFIASGSFVYYALTTGLTLSFMAQYMVNIVRSYIFNDMSIFKDEDKEESSALTESVAHFANSYKPAEGFFTWLFSEDGQDKAAIPAGLNKD